MYWMYYATQVMFQRGGREWKTWNKKFQALLMTNQHPDGFWLTPAIQGFETHCCGMSDTDNKIYSTTLSALQLTVYYRYLPSSVLKNSEVKASYRTEEKTNGEEIIDIFDLNTYQFP